MSCMFCCMRQQDRGNMPWLLAFFYSRCPAECIQDGMVCHTPGSPKILQTDLRPTVWTRLILSRLETGWNSVQLIAYLCNILAVLACVACMWHDHGYLTAVPAGSAELGLTYSG